MVRVFIFLAAVQLVLVVLALISVLSADRVRTLPRALWVVTILLIPLLGPAAYFLTGRPVAERPAGAAPPTSHRPAAPDDDPDFLRTLNAEQARRDRELLAELERQLRAADELRADDNLRDDDLRAANDETRRRDDETRRHDNEDTPPTGV